jgi:XTP/dITP diphosphohydrolase
MNTSSPALRLWIVTRNAHKAAEIRAILGPAFEYETMEKFPDAPEVVEDADTFAGNAGKKAVTMARWLASTPAFKRDDAKRTLVLADDSGLEVDALNGAPGVLSARFAALDGNAGNSSDADNNARLLRLLKDVPLEKRTARFRCVLALVEASKAGPEPARLVEGTCEGRIDLQPSGQGGFGYDPLFIPDGFAVSFAELGEDVKNRLSHRAKALAKLAAHLAAPR